MFVFNCDLILEITQNIVFFIILCSILIKNALEAETFNNSTLNLIQKTLDFYSMICGER
jgi:hypothetical protein